MLLTTASYAVQNGGCIDHVGYYTCDCASGYAGFDWDIDVQRCGRIPCDGNDVPLAASIHLRDVSAVSSGYVDVYAARISSEVKLADRKIRVADQFKVGISARANGLPAPANVSATLRLPAVPLV